MAKFKVGDPVEFILPDFKHLGQRSGKILGYDPRPIYRWKITDEKMINGEVEGIKLPLGCWFVKEDYMILAQPKPTGFLAKELAAYEEDPTRKYRDANLRKVFG